jgi:four helix bundle protein
MFNFKKLDVWQRSIALAEVIYSKTRTFPANERFRLTNQMRQSVVSLSSNIPEGSSRSSKTDFARFVEIAAGSGFELLSQGFIARRQAFLSEYDLQAIYAESEQVGRMLSGLKNSLITK